VVNHHDKKVYGEVEVKIRAFLTSVLDGSESVSRSGRLPPKKDTWVFEPVASHFIN
jgi:hypothetical protein